MAQQLECYWCVMVLPHPWHDDGTPNKAGLQPIIDEYTNHADSTGGGND